jgi:hypothetical protein
MIHVVIQVIWISPPVIIDSTPKKKPKLATRGTYCNYLFRRDCWVVCHDVLLMLGQVRWLLASFLVAAVGRCWRWSGLYSFTTRTDSHRYFLSPSRVPYFQNSTKTEISASSFECYYDVMTARGEVMG